MARWGLRVGLLALCTLALGVAVAQAGSSITVKDVVVTLLEASGDVASEEAVAGSSANLRLTLDHTRTLKVSLKADLLGADGEVAEAGFRPQQAFLRLTHGCGCGSAAYFPAVKAKEGFLYATAKSSDVQKQVGLLSGAYDVALLVGDSRAAQPALLELGQAEVLHPPLDDGSQPEAAPYRAMDALFQPKPAIQHAHRAPERRAPAFVSLAFAAAALAGPVLVFLGLALQAGGNLKAFPTGASALSALGFHAGLAAILALYLLFWLQLNLMQAVPILAGLAAVTAVFGRSALNSLALAQPRPKQE